jgi:hypothetical protein
MAAGGRTYGALTRESLGVNTNRSVENAVRASAFHISCFTYHLRVTPGRLPQPTSQEFPPPDEEPGESGTDKTATQSAATQTNMARPAHRMHKFAIARSVRGRSAPFGPRDA